MTFEDPCHHIGIQGKSSSFQSSYLTREITIDIINNEVPTISLGATFILDCGRDEAFWMLVSQDE